MNPRPRHYEGCTAQAELVFPSGSSAPELAEARPKRSACSAKGSARDVVLAALDSAFESVPVGSLVTAESLRDKLSQPARELLRIPTRKNLLGAYFRALVKAKRVTHDGWTECQRADARHRALRRWKRVA